MRKGVARGAFAAVVGLAVLAAAACEGSRSAPVIGVSYRAKDRAFAAFLQSEVDRRRPPGGAAIRVLEVSLDHPVVDPSITLLGAEVVHATYLAAHPDVVVAVGPGGSREVLQVAPIFREAGLMQLVPTATSRLLRDAGDFVYRMAPDDSAQGAFLGAFADTALRARRAAILYVPDEYGIGLMTGTETALASRGIALLDRMPLRPQGDCMRAPDARAHADLVAQLALRGVPDVVVIAARTVEASCAIMALRSRWPDVAVLMGDGAFVDASFFRRAGTKAEGVYSVVYWHPQLEGGASEAMVRAHDAAKGVPMRHGDARFYDAVMLAAAAIHEGGASRRGVRRFLRSLGRERPAFEGVTGTFSGGPAGAATLVLTRVRGTGTEIVR